MITYTTGNILEAETEALVNTVNCVGIIGKGIALQFESRRTRIITPNTSAPVKPARCSLGVC